MSKQPKSREKKKASAAKIEPKEAEKQPKAEKTTVTASTEEAEKPVEKKKAKKAKKPKIVTHGATPIATVSTARGIVETHRQARGFSLPELQAAGLDAGKGRKLGLRVDTRRGTEISQNVEALKSWITPTAAAPKKKSGSSSSSSGKAEEVSEAPAEQ